MFKMNCLRNDEDTEAVPLRSVQQRSNTNSLDDGRDGYAQSSEPEDEPLQNRNTIKGCIILIVTVVLFVVGISLTQALNQTIPHAELNVLRFFAQLVLSVIALPAFTGSCDMRVDKGSVGWFVAYTVISTVCTTAAYGQAYYLPLGVARGVTSIMVLGLNYIIHCILQRRLTWNELMATVVCLIGVITVTQPPTLFRGSLQNSLVPLDNTTEWPCNCSSTFEVFHRRRSNDEKELTCDHPVNDTEYYTLSRPALGYILCTVEAVTDVIQMHIMKHRLAEVNVFVINVWTAVVAICISCPLMGLAEIPTLPFVPVCVAFFVGHIISSGSHNLLFVRGIQLLTPLAVSILYTLQIPFTFIIQYTLLSDLHPGQVNAVGITGSILVFAGNIIVPGYALYKYSAHK